MMTPTPYDHNLGLSFDYKFDDFSIKVNQLNERTVNLRSMEFTLSLKIDATTFAVTLTKLEREIFQSAWRMPVELSVVVYAAKGNNHLLFRETKLINSLDDHLDFFANRFDLQEYLIEDVLNLRIGLSTEALIGKKFIFPSNATIILNGTPIPVNKEVSVLDEYILKLLSGHSDLLKAMFRKKDELQIDYQFPTKFDESHNIDEEFCYRMGSLTTDEAEYYFRLILRMLHDINIATYLFTADTIEAVLFLANYLQIHAIESVAVEYLRDHSDLFPFFEKYRLLEDVGFKYYRSQLKMSTAETGTKMRENIEDCRLLSKESFEEMCDLLETRMDG